MTPEAVKTIAPYLNAATVDFKGGGNPRFYKEVMQVPSVEPIFECLYEMKKQGIFIEITNLIVPEIGESLDDIKKLVEWIKEKLGEDTPIHFLRFSPNYYLIDLPITPVEVIDKAVKIAEDIGLKYVYTGNVPGHPNESTYCWRCGELLIKRWNVYLMEYKLDGNKCPKCGAQINIGGMAYMKKPRVTKF
jgi:pyruvate formate lyase activating enzyme